MMSQNRQDVKDRLRSELDFDVNRRAETEIQSMSQRMGVLVDKLDDIEKMMRQPVGPECGKEPHHGGRET
jgi:uncharacterized membrane protein